MTDFGTISDRTLTMALAAARVERNPSAERRAFIADMRDEVGFRLYCAQRVQTDDSELARERLMELDSPHITAARVSRWAARYHAALIER